jgi:hypothetical protein
MIVPIAQRHRQRKLAQAIDFATISFPNRPKGPNENPGFFEFLENDYEGPRSAPSLRAQIGGCLLLAEHRLTTFDLQFISYFQAL